MATLAVGTGKQFATIAAAVAAAKDGDTVAVSAGTYVNDFATIHTRINLASVGGPVTMLSTSTAAIAKALLTVTTDATVNGLTFSGMRTVDGTGAGILYQGGKLVVQDSLFIGNQNGLLALASAAGSITIEACEFARNGGNDGFSHNISVSALHALTITDSYIHDAQGGDEVRSLAASTTVSGTRIEDITAAAAYAVDLPNGGAVVLTGDTVEKGGASKTDAALHFGGGTLQASNSLSLTGNILVDDKPGAILLQNQVAAIASVVSNTTYGFAALASGPASLFRNTVAATRPPVSTAALVAGGFAAAVDYGRAGAVVASGHTLTAGAGQQYATVAAAVAASVNGDTIDVVAGTYVNDTAVIGHKVIIEGVGGMARFVDTRAPTNGLAQFVTTTDAMFRNVEIFGVGTVGGVAAAILDQGGNLTIVNSTLHDNQAGIIAAAGPMGGSVCVFDSEIAGNGTADGRGTNVVVGKIGTLTLQNDFVHDAVAGPEVVSAAENTVLDGARVSQAAGNGAAVVLLPNGGLVTVSNSALGKAASSSASPTVLVGGGAAYAGSAVTLVNDVLISSVVGAPATFVSNVAPTVALSVAGTSFVGGLAGSVQVSGGTNTGAKVGTDVTIGTDSPWAAAGSPAAAPLVVSTVAGLVAQQGFLVLYMSEVAYQGDARFSLAVDGVAVVGGLTATATHATGQSESFTIAGLFAPGAHTVAVTFDNSLGTANAGRALYLDGAAFNGQEFGGPTSLVANGTVMLATAPTFARTAVAVNLSEDAWHGDALAFISIDGKVLGGVQAVTATHGGGKAQAMSFLLDLAPGPHTAAVTSLNGVSGGLGASRNLYVDSIDVAGMHYKSAASAVGPSASSAFAFTVAPPAAANGSLFVTSGLPQDLASLLPK